MSDLNPVNPVAMTVFIVFFLLVTVVGFLASRWKAGDLTQLHEWGLGGRQFGTVISWFLVGGDLLFGALAVAQDGLGRFLIGPEVGLGDAGFERFQTFTMRGGVKDNSEPC